MNSKINISDVGGHTQLVYNFSVQNSQILKLYAETLHKYNKN